MSEKNNFTAPAYDVVALSDDVCKWVYNTFGAMGYENVYLPMWREVIKQSHFTLRRKIEISKFLEIAKTFLPNDVESLLKLIETRKIYVTF
jgi:hypothetical protein